MSNYLDISSICFKMQSRVRSSMWQLRFSICTNMQICSIRLIFGLIGVRFDSRYASIAFFSSSKLWWYIGAHAKFKTFQTQTTLYLHFIFPVQHIVLLYFFVADTPIQINLDGQLNNFLHATFPSLHIFFLPLPSSTQSYRAPLTAWIISTQHE